MGSIISELRNAGIARVRGGEPAPGDALSAGSFQRFVVLSRFSVTRLPRAPFQEVRIGVRAYGVTYQDAADLWGDISDVLSNAGNRVAGSVRIYNSLDDVGGSATADPKTSQPYESGTISVYAGT